MDRTVCSRAAGALLAAALVLVPLSARAAGEPFRMITVDEVAKLVGQPGVHVFDANTRETFEKGHLPGATFVTRDTVTSALPKQKDAKLVYYCKNPK